MDIHISSVRRRQTLSPKPCFPVKRTTDETARTLSEISHEQIPYPAGRESIVLRRRSDVIWMEIYCIICNKNDRIFRQEIE
ncbi:hypothetical protein Y032_0140g2176 [Ancylostoma ceylanicum]|uniref:Uncharacterized protein n=1 Tax=Ancylostoma ceylanicum TaxID=53326 RepID=A0A016T450_9BILA|nr:hypothetical protein Y032_0140g2176 [Ancylostoma ceylanicum]